MLALSQPENGRVMRVDEIFETVRPALVCLCVSLFAVGLATSCSDDSRPADQRCEGAACSNPQDTGAVDAGNECTVDDDCPGSATCENGSCSANTVQCFDDEDCEGGYCDDGTCESYQRRDTGGESADATDGGGVPDVEADGGMEADSGTETDTGTDAESCSGCLFDDNNQSGTQCVPGTDDGACGSGGEQCKECGGGEECNDQGQCVEVQCSPLNCDGCCQNGDCKDGTEKSACGSEGEQCASCQGQSKCLAESLGGSCQTCNGCWEGNVCESGTSDSACGNGGESCTSCGSQETCDSGTCVEKAQDCSATCDGCCTGGSCRAGTSDTACGADGDYCRSCQTGFTCETSGSGGACSLDPDSRWDIVAVKADVEDRTPNGVYWDPGINAHPPEPYVEVSVDTGTQTKTVKTDYPKDDYTPYWSETTVVNVRAEAIMSSTTYTVMDYDPAYRGSDDRIVGSCDASFRESDFDQSTWTTEFNCDNHPDGSSPTTIEFRLEPH